MRSEKEIKEQITVIEGLRDGARKKQDLVELNYYEGVIKSLKWVIEDLL